MSAEVIRRELLLRLQRLGVQREVLLAARSEATQRLAQLEREEDRLRRNLSSLERGEEA